MFILAPNRRWTSDGYLNQREIKFREEQEAFPNEIWERGEKAPSHGVRRLPTELILRLRRYKPGLLRMTEFKP